MCDEVGGYLLARPATRHSTLGAPNFRTTSLRSENYHAGAPARAPPTSSHPRVLKFAFLSYYAIIMNRGNCPLCHLRESQMEFLLKHTRLAIMAVSILVLIRTIIGFLIPASYLHVTNLEVLESSLRFLLWSYVYVSIFVVGVAFLTTLIQLAVVGLLQDQSRLEFEERRRLMRLAALSLLLLALDMGAWIFQRMAENRLLYNQTIEMGFILVILMGAMMQAVFWIFWGHLRQLDSYRYMEAEAIFGRSPVTR